MNVHVARQPIFDKNMNVFAYELLYRSEHGFNDDKDGSQKTGEVVFNTLVNLGLDNMLGGKKAFINFTKDTIDDELPKMFSNEILVVEILEDVIPDETFLNQCKMLKDQGYVLALDDFDSSYSYEDVIGLVDIIKVDFLSTTVREREELVKKYSTYNVKFLAEKVETKDEFEEAISLGYDYFQGFFFSKPVLVSGNDFRVFNNTYLLLLSELNKEEPSYDELEQIVKKDFSITFKLLKLVNSAAFYSRNRITTIRHALTMLGFKELKKWFSLLMIRDVGDDQPKELTRMSLIRAKMLEAMLKQTHLKSHASEGFLIGLLSLADVILDRRMEEIITDIPLDDEIIKALFKEEGLYTDLLIVVEHYEKGEWEEIKPLIDPFMLDFLDVSNYYLEAIDWVNIIENSK
ncbi:HDOD domain-containing protein [Acidaminobacter sp. JC074]|uniref:EAL and HDOD domain-containing protein n=1 Tax=Acidaminobacter sp. JC074 TaxID=2530199 RepID=UPI001F10D759|nr:HDOD domain-containing protein [Acidaminobacter sp. JC074]MCH4891298.1 HDOD domain-containing protein [Acidaminobacter sp. JC074]